MGHRERSEESGGDERDELLDLPRLRAARVCALVCDLWALLALLRGEEQEQEQGDGAIMTPAQDMATRRIANSLSYLEWIDGEIRWFREHPARTAAAKRASKQSLALLAESRAKVIALIRRIETENGLENWSEL